VDHPIPGLPRRRADIVFVGARVAVFVDGCFWHGCPDHCVRPKANAAWWREKIATNRRRDAETNAALSRLGWCVIRVWEHENPTAAAMYIRAVVLDRSKITIDSSRSAEANRNESGESPESPV
jgi:DNA mismatch endonuclease (patch repair protein)